MNFLSYNKMVNIKQFASFMMFREIFTRMAYPGSQFYVNELAIRKGLAFTTLAVSQRMMEDAKDPIVHEEGQQYNFDRAIKK